jgi:hypothetical protein
MKKQIAWCVALGCLAMAFTGCYTSQDGKLRVGTPFTKDKLVSRYERPYAQVHNAAKEVLKQMGTLTNDDVEQKMLKGRVDASTVWITLDDTEARIVKVTIQARTSGGGANVDLASEVDKRIYGVLINSR